MVSNSKFILFDYDGTIVNSETAILNGIKYTLNFYGYKLPSDKTLRSNIGRPLIYRLIEHGILKLQRIMK